MFSTTQRLCLAALLMVSMMPAKAQRKVSSFSETKIVQGATATIGGKEYTEPDIIYTDKGDGTYEATRLTVSPAGPSTVTAPYLLINTPTSINICWKTSTDATGSKVRIGTRPDALTRVLDNTATSLAADYYWNECHVDGLKAATTYYYQVESCGVTSRVYRFTTAPQPGDKAKVRLLLIGDHQRNDHSDYEWMLKAAKATADRKWGQAEMNEHFRLLVNVGDQVDRGELKQYDQTHLFKSRSVMSSLPILTTVGNHELKSDDKLVLYNGHYHRYGDIEYQGIKSGTANYYAYQTGSVLIMVLNTDGTGPTQKEWARQVIQAADKDASVQFIMAVNHRPLYAEQYCNDYSSWMLLQLMPILQRSPKFVLDYAGHHHLYARGQMTNAPVYHIISGGGVGTSAKGYEQLWGTTPDNLDRQEVQKTLDQWTYQIVEFDPESKTMDVECYSVGNSRLALDNELVDHFSRKIGDSSMPTVPAIDGSIDGTAFPIAIHQAAAATGLHSAQYQVARDADFTDVVLSRVVTFEDMYGANDDYTPKNLNPSGEVTTLSISDGEVEPGTYYVRCRNRNMNLNWSDYSEGQEFVVTAKSALPMVKTDKRIYAPGEDIVITFDNASTASGWVGIYKRDKNPGKGNPSVKWANTKTASGSVTFQIKDAYEYYVVLFQDGGYTTITDRVPFIVTANTNDGDQAFEMALDKTVYDEGEPIVVSLAHAPALSKDWVGVYDTGQAGPGDPIVSGVYSYLWANVTKPTGSVTLNVAGTINTVPPTGYYFVEYFFMNNYTSFFPRQYFVVGRPAVVEADKAAYGSNETCAFYCYNLPTWDTPCLVLVGKDGKTKKTFVQEGETATMAARTLAELSGAGTYTAYIALGDERISEPIHFTVGEATAIDAVSSSPYEVKSQGGHVTVSGKAIRAIRVCTVDGKTIANWNGKAQSHVSLPVQARGVVLVQVNAQPVVKVVAQ